MFAKFKSLDLYFAVEQLRQTLFPMTIYILYKCKQMTFLKKSPMEKHVLGFKKEI